MKAYLQVPPSMSEETILHICGRFDAMFSEKIEYKCKKNPALLGGFIAEVGGKVFDCSISSKMETLRQRMLDIE